MLSAPSEWEKSVVPVEEVVRKVEPGMRIFLGTGAAEPRTLVHHLMAADQFNVQDLELIQIASFGEALSRDALERRRYRLKTFFAGWVASEEIRAGRVDLIPSRFSAIPSLFESGTLRVDVAFVQITPPDEAGYASLGVAVDAARQAMEQASLVVGEVNERMPRTFGDTLIDVRDFHMLVRSTEEPYTFPRWPADGVFERVAANTAALIEDGSCIAFSVGPLFEALAGQLRQKRHLGVHSPIFTDALRDLVECRAVDNRRKRFFRGTCLTSYALGTESLLGWLDRNPLVEFQSIDVVSSPGNIAQNDRVIAVLAARKVDLTGRIALHIGRQNLATGPAEAYELCTGASLSHGGRTIAALPSRNRKGASNLVVSVEGFPNEFPHQELVDCVVTEYGVAHLRGRTARERAQALIDVAHPDDRAELVRRGKSEHLLYADQIYLPESGRLYPSEIGCTQTFAGGLRVVFRAVKPSDEEEMRRFFYRFSDEAVYYRYFSPIKTMPHQQMQKYVNVDYRKTLSVVGLLEGSEDGRIIAEGRFVQPGEEPVADVAFLVDEEYQGRGIASFLFVLLTRIAKERGLQGFTASVLASNKSMLKVFEKTELPIEARVEQGVYDLTIPFEGSAPPERRGIRIVR